MNEFYRVTRLDDNGKPLNWTDGDGPYASNHFESKDIKQIEHWIFHIHAHDPQAEFQILQVVEREVERDE